MCNDIDNMITLSNNVDAWVKLLNQVIVDSKYSVKYLGRYK